MGLQCSSFLLHLLLPRWKEGFPQQWESLSSGEWSECLTQVRRWKTQWESRKKCDFSMWEWEITKWCLYKLMGGKKGKIHCGLWNTKMPQVSGGISEMPMSGGCGITLGEESLPLWLHFSLHVWFHPLWNLWQGGWVLSGIWGDSPDKPNPSPSCTENSQILAENSSKSLQKHHSWTLAQQTTTFCNRTFSRACFLIKTHSQGPLLIKRSKAKLGCTKAAVLKLSKWMWTEMSKESEDYSENNLFDRTRAVQFQ